MNNNLINEAQNLFKLYNEYNDAFNKEAKEYESTKKEKIASLTKENQEEVLKMVIDSMVYPKMKALDLSNIATSFLDTMDSLKTLETKDIPQELEDLYNKLVDYKYKTKFVVLEGKLEPKDNQQLEQIKSNLLNQLGVDKLIEELKKQ